MIEILIRKTLEKFRRITYLGLADIYFEVAYEERVSLFSLEYKMLRKDAGKLMVDDLSCSVDALNYNVKKVNPMRFEKFCSEFN